MKTITELFACLAAAFAARRLRSGFSSASPLNRSHRSAVRTRPDRCCSNSNTCRRCPAVATSAAGFQPGCSRSERGARRRYRAGGADAVVAALNGRIKDHEEFEPISNLLRDSHYLAPSFSPISPDLWRDIAGMVRNLCLNWILLVPPMILRANDEGHGLRLH